MTDQSRKRYPVSSVGYLAHEFLNRSGRGSVEAVFDRSVYIRCGDDCICLGVDSLGQGPLNVTTGISEETWRSDEYTTGMPVEISPGTLRIGKNPLFDIKGARVWTPVPLPEADVKTVEKGLRALEEGASGMVPDDGLGGYLFERRGSGREQGPVFRHARLPLKGLERWLQAVLCDVHGSARPHDDRWKALIGLGPGLTPSGDDLLGGAMLALRSLGEIRGAKRLFASVRADLAWRTHPISAAHLMAAGEGMGHERLHAVLYAVLSGRCSGYRNLLEGVGSIGHTSGWDALSGVAIVCRTWVEVRREERKENLSFSETTAGI